MCRYRNWFVCGVFLILMAVFAVPVTLAAQAGFQVDAAKPNLEFKAEFSDGGEWDVGSDLNLDSGSVVQAQLFLNDRLRLSYGDFFYEGTANLKKIGRVEAALQSELDLEYVGVGYFHPLFVSDKAMVEGIFDVKGYRLTSRAAGMVNGYPLLERELPAMEGIVPALGLRLTQSISDRLNVYGEVLGLPLGDLAAYWEWHTGARYEVEDLAMQAGYRVVDVFAKNNLLDADLKARFSGPYAGVSYTF